ncbi:XRE family transcriptional regulator [Pseudomonas fakonensis]|uniref:XRE family transcriptional regulator n=1 Tax=Pseudomonas fakonensis TaxID=2842355 RepID=A0ABX8MXS2_9PSED|nr:XRE family transcriptional regulator [Pseudomonas fakonensis]QXH49100.1 XRE family transcriptional regulator [Pseudomonas fakonensis]
MNIEQLIACRLAELRTSQRLSLAQLAERAGVGKATISKIERQDSSPTAAILGRLAAGLGVPLSQLLAEEQPATGTLRRHAMQPTWCDPATGYVRRQVADADPASGNEMVEIELPAGARVDYPHWQAGSYRQRLWLLQGTLRVTHGDEHHQMHTGDLLAFAVDRPLSYQAGAEGPCRYLLNILHLPRPV